MGSESISVDEFQALEQKVLLTVELIKKEREARAAAEAALAETKAEVATLQEQLANVRGEAGSAQQMVEVLKQELAAAGDVAGENARLQQETESLLREREAVRVRVERMLASIDELG
jgi:chromosome segregation ATPase